SSTRVSFARLTISRAMPRCARNSARHRRNSSTYGGFEARERRRLLSGEFGRQLVRALAGAADGGLDPLQHVGEGGAVEDARGRIAHVLHHHADAAGAFVATVLAADIGELADAANRGEGAFGIAKNFTEGDLARRAAEEIAAALALLALENPAIAQFEENQFEEFARDSFALGDIGDKDGSLAVFLGQHQCGLQRIF